MLPENRTFMVRGEDGQEYGPVDLEELREWVQENRAGLGTEVRRDEPGSAWNPWQNYPELIALLAEANATGRVSNGDTPVMIIAPLWKRFLAYAMDLILISVLTTPILLTLAIIYIPDWLIQYVVASSHPPYTYSDPPTTAKVIGSVIYYSVLALYFTGFHAAHGMTPGKALLRLRVVNQSGSEPGLMHAFLRSFILIFSMSFMFIPFLYVFINPQRRALHDMIADTCVVKV